MANIDLTTALARLLSDETLRRNFAADPRGVAEQLSVRAADLPGFLALDRDGIERQARTLLEKRRYEVVQLLPKTFAHLDLQTENLFYEYAQNHWPNGHLRHLDDAVEFGRFLTKRRHPALDRAEFNRVQFLLNGWRLCVRLLAKTFVGGRTRPAMQILYRRRCGYHGQILAHFAF